MPAVYVPKFQVWAFRAGAHVAGELVLRKTMRTAVKFTAAAPCLVAHSRTLWEAEREWSITKNGAEWATVVFPIAGDPDEDGLFAGVVTVDGDVVEYAAGDVLRLFAPADVDATGQDCSFDFVADYATE